jgi:hypothetical protein
MAVATASIYTAFGLAEEVEEVLVVLELNLLFLEIKTVLEMAGQGCYVI